MLALTLCVLLTAPVAVPIVTQPPPDPPQHQPPVHIDIHENEVGELWRELRDADRQIDALEDQIRGLLEVAGARQADYREAGANLRRVEADVQREEAAVRAAEGRAKKLDRQLQTAFESSPQAQALKQSVNESRRQILELRREARAPLEESEQGRRFLASTSSLRQALAVLRASARPTMAAARDGVQRVLRQQADTAALLAERLGREARLRWYAVTHQQALASLGDARQDHNVGVGDRREWRQAQEELDRAMQRLLDVQDGYEVAAREAGAARRESVAARLELAVWQDRLGDAREQRDRIARDLRRAHRREP